MVTVTLRDAAQPLQRLTPAPEPGTASELAALLQKMAENNQKALSILAVTTALNERLYGPTPPANGLSSTSLPEGGMLHELHNAVDSTASLLSLIQTELERVTQLA